jgi:hypothetical protein
MLLRSLCQRERLAELMDQPDLAAAEHVYALTSLERINWWSGSAAVVWSMVLDAAQKASRPLRVLDVATGAGDVPIRLWLNARRAGLQLNLAACDCSEVALQHARSRAESAGACIEFFQWDILHGPPPRRFDIVLSSLFLHQLSEKQAVMVLIGLASITDDQVLINDLRRSRFGWWAAYVGCRALTASRVVRFDGPVSVLAAFTCDEALALAEQAGLRDAVVRRRFPFRFLLQWRRS